MTQSTDVEIKKTPLYSRHCEHGARIVEFGGWSMPVEYESTGLSSEHAAVRASAGLFDVSHMGQIEVAGTDALAAVQKISCNDASLLRVGQAQYSGLMTPVGTFVDDLLVYRLAETHFLLVVNAGNILKDFAWIRDEIRGVGDAVAVNSSSRYALLALQGPRAAEILQPLTGVDLSSIRYYWFATGEIGNSRVTISRTGYTGEDGFEIFVSPQAVEGVWNSVLQAGASFDLLPIGLGARDTLRLEASMRLYGSDIDDSTTVLEAGLGWIVGWNKGEFTGRDALLQQRAKGVEKRLVGFEITGRGIGRRGYAVYAPGGAIPVGRVTSGTMTPYLKKAIGMAYVPTELSKPDTELAIDIRGRHVQAIVVTMPFYSRG